jgi:hypothetical protein
MEEKIILSFSKHIAVLYPSEIQKLLLTDDELYIKAMKRGKSEKRYQANEKRMDHCNKETEGQEPKI